MLDGLLTTLPLYLVLVAALLNLVRRLALYGSAIGRLYPCKWTSGI